MSLIMPEKWVTVNVFSYDLPHTIYDTHVYPRKSSNGSTVIIYGHETGLRVVWYAGRKFSAESKAPKVNGHGTNEATVIDLDDDDDETEATKKADFEDELDEIDPSSAYYGVLRHLDIPLGSAALKLAVPHLPTDNTDETPAVLESSIVVAAACADYSTRVILISLDPPAPAITDASKAGLQICKLPVLSYHQSLISSLAIAHTGEGLDDDGEAQPEESSQHSSWSLLIASVSPTGSGLLLVHQIAGDGWKLGDATLLRRVALRSPVMAAKISFNTAAPPAERHSNLLITIPDAPCVKVYQVFPPRLRHRRGSNATNQSGSTSRTTTSSMSAGKFLVTLLPEFKPSRNGEAVRRKRVLDAKWISGGRAVIALLEDGEWGIWDLEAAGPTGSNNVIQGQSNVTGIVGGGITKFAVKGSGVSKSKTTKDAPSETSKQHDHDSFHPSSGIISVVQKRNDDSVILSYDGEAQLISSVTTHWKSRITGKGALQATDRATVLPSLRTGGDSIKGIAILPSYPNEARQGALEQQLVPNFLVCTSSRLILHVNPLAEPEDVGPLNDDALKSYSGSQSLLEQGGLDLDGVDRSLEDMFRSRPASRLQTQQQPSRGEIRARPNFGSSMMSHDGDIDMGVDSPTPTKNTQTLFAPKFSSTKSTPRRLFS
jgi:hypothetical protein